MKISNQLSLPISITEERTFANFYIGNNQLLLQSLQKNLCQVEQKFFYIWGDISTGKSHVAQAAINYYNQLNKNYSYIPLTEHHQLQPEILENQAYQDLIILDDLDAIAGALDWETAIFNLYNQIKQQAATIMIITAHASPNSINLSLKDLRSRLSWGEVYQLKALTDQQKIKALQYYAKERGLDISDETAQFLIKRIDRDMKTLLNKLDILDKVSLQEQRKITIPLIKEFLNI